MKQKQLINNDYRHFNSTHPQKRSSATRPPLKYALVITGIILSLIIAVIVLTGDDSDDVSTSDQNTSTAKITTTTLDLNITSQTDQKSAIPSPIVVDPTNTAEAATPNNTTVAAAPAPPNSEPSDTEAAWISHTVRSGDTLAKFLSRAGLSPQQVHALINTDKNTRSLTKIFPGDVFNIQINKDGELQKLTHEINETSMLEVNRNSGKLSSNIIDLPVEKRLGFSHGTITSSLFLAAQAAGLSDKSTMELAGIFAWDIDFALDIREGDNFSVLYEEIYRDGAKVRDGAIVAAEFTNQNRTYKAIRFKTDDGFSNYYAPDGESMRKEFLRTPVEFSRISSKFNLKRRHPVLNTIRAHKGVDYAAPTGTPIQATANGKVIFKGTKGGYGKTIVLQHGSKYSTLYAHMSRYAKGMRNDLRVRQGQVIGYIGMSGLATGPHLHYEFRVNGVHRNPLTVKFPIAEPLEKKYIEKFNKTAESLLTTIAAKKQTQLALGN